MVDVPVGARRPVPANDQRDLTMASINKDPIDDRRRPRRMTFAVWRNPLARSTDRTQAGLLLLAIALWLIALPIVAAAGSMIWSGISEAATVQQETRTTVTARLLADAPNYSYSSEYGTPVSPTVTVIAEWTGPDGRLHSGSVEAAGGARSGDQQSIWIDKAGGLVDPPIVTGFAAVLMVVATVAAWLAWGALLWVWWLTVRWRLNKRRANDWDQQWETIEPVWSGR
jgi:hypothetical protein